ncbi:SDR family NAD(P)-dependent oxidoreductase [Streptomyces sp. NPDC101227]|uniref:SDR family NAD(P)-dependent oxidoreductase n=1 Tax=Streptomyces sp. NPDC101227 TaxID=3366136 RepID=UPI00382EC1FC
MRTEADSGGVPRAVEDGSVTVGGSITGDGSITGAGAVIAGAAVTDDELAAFDRTIARLRALPLDDPRRVRAERAAGTLVREARMVRRKERRRQQAAADAAVLAATATGAPERREDTALDQRAGTVGELSRPRRCYVCKALYRRTDSFYHLLCPPCARDNAGHRALRTDLTGRRVLLTGGRVKIGFQLALMMLRDGAELLVTSRFPRDTRRRFAAAPGSADWLGRLTVIGIDLRDPRQVLGLCQALREEGRPLDVLVNNAAQTIRRAPASYALLTARERGELPDGIRLAPGFRSDLALLDRRHAGALGLVPRAATAPVPGTAVAPASACVPTPAPVRAPAATPGPAAELTVDEAGLLPDASPANSWTVRLGDLDPAELLETQLVNALAPTLLCDRLLPLLLASPHPRRYVVNVSAVEGRFAVHKKTGRHPHTNMAKAALNMLTRTSGPELAAHGVHMCSVDTGWITDENPLPIKDRSARAGFRTPLDIVDGAARVYDPIVRGEAGDPVSGVFLKDYREADW